MSFYGKLINENNIISIESLDESINLCLEELNNYTGLFTINESIEVITEANIKEILNNALNKIKEVIKNIIQKIKDFINFIKEKISNLFVNRNKEKAKSLLSKLKKVNHENVIFEKAVSTSKSGDFDYEKNKEDGSFFKDVSIYGNMDEGVLILDVDKFNKYIGVIKDIKINPETNDLETYNVISNRLGQFFKIDFTEEQITFEDTKDIFFGSRIKSDNDVEKFLNYIINNNIMGAINESLNYYKKSKDIYEEFLKTTDKRLKEIENSTNPKELIEKFNLKLYSKHLNKCRNITDNSIKVFKSFTQLVNISLHGCEYYINEKDKINKSNKDKLDQIRN